MLSLLAIATGLWQLDRASDGLRISRASAGTIPVTVFRPASDEPAPVVVIAHGFAGSQQLMLPFAVTLARNGYIAVTFDFPGHAKNSAPLPAGLADQDAFTGELLKALGSVTDHARSLRFSDGRLALLGHSMASDIVVRYAQAHTDIEATVAVSLFFPRSTEHSPRNLLIIDGALEPKMLHDEGYRIVGLAANGDAKAGVTYGNFADGSARRLALARSVEHIGVLYAHDSMAEALGWMNAAFGKRGTGFLDARGGWLGLLYLGLIAFSWPLSALLPRVAASARGAALGWRRLLPVAIAPAVLTPLILWPLPTQFLPILLGDYLVLHFALYGLLTAVAIRFARRPGDDQPWVDTGGWQLVVAALMVAAYSVFAIGVPIDRYVTSFIPGVWRLPLILAMLCGTLPYFLADEWMTRGAGGTRWGYAFSKLCFLLSLVLAVAMNLQELFFLIIIVPVILIFFVVYGLFSRWVFQRCRQPLVAALANAVVFAWFIAVTFPIVSR